jgi:hypothetical protein
MPLNGIYRPVLDTIAYQQLTKRADIPNVNLGIDHAEDYQPYGLAYYKLAGLTKQNVVIPDPTWYPIEEVAANFQGNPVKQADFPAEFFLGNPIGGF